MKKTFILAVALAIAIFIIFTILFFPSKLGGCFGTAGIENLVVEPAIPCLSIKANNCNGGVLTIINTCREELTVGDLKINRTSFPDGKENFRENTVELIKDSENNNVAIKSRGIYASYYPSEKETMRISGMIGNSSFNISYVKNPELNR